MNEAIVTMTTKKPRPPEADFAFYIDYQKGAGSPSRIFAATHDFIRACERLDHELVQTIDSNIETVMVLEDIEVGSIKTWFKNILKATDDQALKKLEWKPIVGEYLVRAKYAIIQWCDKEDQSKNLVDLGKQIQQIAAETDVRHLPDYRMPPPSALMNAVKDFQSVKDHFVPGDHIKVITPDGEIEMNLSIRMDIENLESLAVKETIQFPSASMILAVKKPDYLGDSKWELRHGKRNILAKIEDMAWVKKFQARKVDVRPGDSIKCETKIEHLYGHDNELISERYTVTKVVDVLVNAYREQTSLFGAESSRPSAPEEEK